MIAASEERFAERQLNGCIVREVTEPDALIEYRGVRRRLQFEKASTFLGRFTPGIRLE